MPGAGHGEAGEDPDGVHRDERGDLGVGGEQEGDRGAGEEEDAVGEHEPVAPDGELAGQEGVLGDEADEEGEAGEARVGGQDQDEGRRGLQRVEEDRARRAGAVDELADLGDDRRGPGHEGDGVGERGEHRDAEEHRPEDACS